MLNNSFIKNMPWMDNPAYDLEPLFIEHGEKRVHKKNSVFKNANESNDKLFYLQQGLCYTYTLSENGDVHISRILTRGSVFGEVTSVIGGGISLTYTKAAADSTVYALKYRKLLDLVTGNKALTHAVIETYAWRVGAYHISLYIKNTFTNEQKVALLFMSLHEPSDTDEFFTLPLSFSHRQIGEIVGLARETVSRVLSKWKNNGFIKTSNNSISIKPAALRKILGEPRQSK